MHSSSTQHPSHHHLDTEPTVRRQRAVGGAATATLLVVALGAAAFLVWSTQPSDEPPSPMAIAAPLLGLDAAPEPVAAPAMPQPADVVVPDHDREQAEMATHGG